MGRAIKSIFIVSVIVLFAVAATRSYFSDTETSVGNTLVAGAIDLLVDNESYYNGVLNPGTSWIPSDLDDTTLFFNFLDLKPSDWGEDTISLRVDTNDAWACMDIELTADDDTTCTEPENEDDPNCVPDNDDLFDGELGSLVNFIFWADDGDNVLEDNEEEYILEGPANEVLNSSVALADSEGSVFPSEALAESGAFIGEETYYIGKAWCFGTLTPEPLTQDNGSDTDRSPATTTGGIACDGSGVDNAAQTDSVLGNVSFRAIQARNNEDFTCGDPEPTPTPLACFPGWAVEAVATDQGLRKNGTAVLAERSNPAYMLGPADTSGSFYDNPVPANSFYSLGFPLDGRTASVVVDMGSAFENVPGPDIKLYEVTGGTSYPDERVNVDITGSNPAGPWTPVATNVARDAEIDIDPIVGGRHIRITDSSNINLFEDTADGYDLDAVYAYCLKRAQ